MDNLKNNWWVFPGFEIEHLVTGLDLPVNIAFVKNPPKNPKSPLLYITELYGQVKAVTNDWSVFTYAEGLLNYKPDYKFPGSGESGVTGIVVEPETGDLFLSMIYHDGLKVKSKVIRTKSANGLKIDSQTVVIDNIPSVHAAHQIQALTIGADNKLYVNLGDGMIDSKVAQDNNDPRGKVLRMNLDGKVPSDNPNPKSFVYAKGFRNPFGATWRKSDKALYISDNGPNNDDRIAKVLPGSNYRWPISMRKDSIFYWDFTQGVTAIDFCQNKEFPEKFNDELFVSLFGGAYAKGRSVKGKKIVKIRINESSKGIVSYDEFVTYIGNGPGSPCGLSFGPGGLYFTDLHGEKNDQIKSKTGNLFRVKPKNKFLFIK